MNTIKAINYRGHEITISYDPDPLNPITEFDNPCEFILFHSRYNLGHDHEYNQNDYDSWEAMSKSIRSEDDTIDLLPVFMYDHSGITISASSFSCSWDSSQIGFIVARKSLFDKLGCSYDKASDIMQSQIDEYDQYLRGEIYCYSTEEDNCSNFYDIDDCIAEAKRVIDYTVNEQIKSHVSRLKQMILNKVPLPYRVALSI